MLRRIVRGFLEIFPSIAFVTAIALLYFPVPFLGWVLLTLAISSLISVKIKNILNKPVSLINRIDQLKQPDNRLLTSEEIESFKKLAKPNDLNQLAQYEKFTTDTCGITLSEMSEIAEPITIQHKDEAEHLSKTYDKSALKTWINTKGINVTEPMKRWHKLNDSKIEIYAGFPHWVQSFVKYVLNVLKQSPKTKKEMIAEERGHFYQKHFKTLFPAHTQPLCDEKPVPHASPSITVAY